MFPIENELILIMVWFLHPSEGEQNLPPPNMPPCPVNYFKLVIFKKMQTQKKNWKLSRSYPFVRDICIHKRNLFVRVSPTLCQEKGRLNSLETLVREKVRTSICITTSTLFTEIFLVTSITDSIPPMSSFVFSWRWYLRGWCWPFQGVTSLLELYKLWNFCFTPVHLF